jgi:hypothetical protein
MLQVYGESPFLQEGGVPQNSERDSENQGGVIGWGKKAFGRDRHDDAI